MGFVLEHAGHALPVVVLGGWLLLARLARARAARSLQDERAAGSAPGAGSPAAAVTAEVAGPPSATAAGHITSAEPMDLSLEARLLLTACSIGAAVVHADVITSHFEVSALYGWFFVLSAATQLAWGLLVLRRPDRALLAAGAIGNGLIVALWAVTRTAGLPIGPTPWEAESAGAFDVVATALELALVIGSLALLAGARRSRLKHGSRETPHMLANLHASPASKQNSAGRFEELRSNGDERHAALAGADHGHRAGRPSESGGGHATVSWILDYLPRGNMLTPQEWHKRHTFLQWILFIHLPGLFIFGLVLHHPARTVALGLLPLVGCLALGRVVSHRRLASLAVTAGLVYSSIALVVFSRGSIEAHFHFFVIIGFIALYQDWVPFLWNAVFTSLSHGVGTLINREWIFNHQAGQANPWAWSAIHGIAVLAACIGVVVFWKNNEDEQDKSLSLTRRLADAEIGRRKFTSDMLVNLARRNQSLLYRQLGIINQLEEQERDPDALAELFRLDHLATRIRRNAESLLVLSGEGPPRTWSEPVLLLDVVRAAIAETEDLDRVAFYLDERLAVAGNTVTDLTHLLAELVENAVRFSPPEASVIIRLRPYPASPGSHVLTIEDCGIGMRREDLEAANEVLAHPQEVDLSVSQRLGLHVVARLAERHGITVSLTATPGTGITAVVVLPETLFGDLALDTQAPAIRQHAMPVGAVATPSSPYQSQAPRISAGSRNGGEAAPPVNGNGPFKGNGSLDVPTDFGLGDDDEPWSGWWEPVLEGNADQDPADAFGDPGDGFGDPGSGGPAPGNGSTSVRMGNGRSESNRYPEAAPEPPGAPAGEAPLTRRVPQSHLAPELREPTAIELPPQRAVPDGNRTREALSRYQASRRAARALVEGQDTTDTDPSQGTGGRS
jgi:signal transduction histidine kinase